MREQLDKKKGIVNFYFHMFKPPPPLKKHQSGQFKINKRTNTHDRIIFFKKNLARRGKSLYNNVYDVFT